MGKTMARFVQRFTPLFLNGKQRTGQAIQYHVYFVPMYLYSRPGGLEIFLNRLENIYVPSRLSLCSLVFSNLSFFFLAHLEDLVIIQTIPCCQVMDIHRLADLVFQGLHWVFTEESGDMLIGFVASTLAFSSFLAFLLSFR